MNPESVPYFQRFTVANMILAAVLAFARPVIDATTEPPTTIEIERQAAADERPIMIQSVSVHQESWIDQLRKEFENVERATATTGRGSESDLSGSVRIGEEVSGRTEGSEGTNLEAGGSGA